MVRHGGAEIRGLNAFLVGWCGLVEVGRWEGGRGGGFIVGKGRHRGNLKEGGVGRGGHGGVQRIY